MGWRADLSLRQLQYCKAAYGYYSKRPGFRTYFIAGLGDRHMLGLVAKSYFEGPYGIGTVGDLKGVYLLTVKGIEFLNEVRRRDLAEWTNNTTEDSNNANGF